MSLIQKPAKKQDFVLNIKISRKNALNTMHSTTTSSNHTFSIQNASICSQITLLRNTNLFCHSTSAKDTCVCKSTSLGSASAGKAMLRQRLGNQLRQRHGLHPRIRCKLAWQSLNKTSCHPNHDFFTTMYKKCGMAAEARSPPDPTFNSKCDDLNSLMSDFSRAELPRDDSNIHKAIAKKPLDR